MTDNLSASLLIRYKRWRRLRLAAYPVFVLFMLVIGNPDTVSIIAGSLLILLGVGLRFLASRVLQKAQILTTHGIYQYLAHPFYLGTLLGFAGLAVISRQLASLAAFVALVMLHIPFIRLEEDLLWILFGQEYESYRATLPQPISGTRRRLQRWFGASR